MHTYIHEDIHNYAITHNVTNNDINTIRFTMTYIHNNIQNDTHFYTRTPTTRHTINDTH